MDGDCQHLGVAPEKRLCAVAVVHVEVDVKDPMAGIARARHTERNVVVDAEAAGSCRGSVVQPAARMEGVLDLASQDAVNGVDRAAGDGRRRLRACLRRAGNRPARCPSSAAAMDRGQKS